MEHRQVSANCRFHTEMICLAMKNMFNTGDYKVNFPRFFVIQNIKKQAVM